jgi:protoporphyrinogen oxidase
MKPTITIIGAGISGLTAAVYLHKNGYKVQILEATERAGGRVKTNTVNGFLLDRGFQVFLTEYPEAKALLDYQSLQLKKFLPGAMVLFDGGNFEIADPFRRPNMLFSTIMAPVGNLLDKWKTFTLKNKLVNTSVGNIFKQNENTTLHKLKEYGFSNKMIERFYQPFFAGIFLENQLKTSSNMFDFVLKMFSEGDAAIPELGMEEIPKQLLSMLPENTVSYLSKVIKLENNTIFCENGLEVITDKVIIATEATGFASEFLAKDKQNYQSVTNIYFEADQAPTDKSLVILNASKTKKSFNNLTVLSNISSKYAPKDKVLLSVSINGILDEKDTKVEENIKKDLENWFGEQVYHWKFLKSYRIPYALPNQEKVYDTIDVSHLKIKDNVFICGDFLLNGSINAAMKSGRLVAELIQSEVN